MLQYSDTGFTTLMSNSQFGAGTIVVAYPNFTTVSVLDGGGTNEFFIFVY